MYADFFEKYMFCIRSCICHTLLYAARCWGYMLVYWYAYGTHVRIINSTLNRLPEQTSLFAHVWGIYIYIYLYIHIFIHFFCCMWSGARTCIWNICPCANMCAWHIAVCVSVYEIVVLYGTVYIICSCIWYLRTVWLLLTAYYCVAPACVHLWYLLPCTSVVHSNIFSSLQRSPVPRGVGLPHHPVWPADILALRYQGPY